MKVITFSREIGSYGDEIASVVARRLNYHLVDQNEIHQRAQACDKEYKDACSAFDLEEPKGFFQRFFFDKPAYASLFESLNYELAAGGDVVIVGRGAELVLGSLDGVLSVDVVAPLAVRVNRVMEWHNWPAVEAENFVRHHEKLRNSMIESIFRVDLEGRYLHDVTINTAKMTVDEAVEIVVAAAKNAKPIADEAQWRENLNGLALAKRLESTLRKSLPEGPLGGIEVKPCEPGVVSLEGLLTDLQTKAKAEKIAKEFEGVKEVRNNLRYLETLAP
jgi:cytidylate kinase